MTDEPAADGPKDQDRDEMALQADLGPDRSLTYRATEFLVEHLLTVLAGVVLVGFAVTSVLDVDVPRSVRLIGVVAAVTTPLVGRPAGKRVVGMLWDPSFVWLVDLDARRFDAGIYRIPAQRFREWDVTDGSLDWVTPHLAFGKNVDLVNSTVEGCWRGTLSDRELMRSLQAVEECRGQLEDDAKRGFAIESQMWTIVRGATRQAVMRVVSTFERGTLPDEGEGITEEIDSAIEQFGLERKIRQTEQDDSPAADVPGADLDVDPLADLDDAPEGGAPADD